MFSCFFLCFVWGGLFSLVGFLAFWLLAFLASRLGLVGLFASSAFPVPLQVALWLLQPFLKSSVLASCILSITNSSPANMFKLDVCM